MTTHPPISVLSVASEAFPLVKTGGLADVVGALPAALAQHGVAVTTLIPGYPATAPAVKGARVVHRWPDLLGTPARLLATTLGEQSLLILDAPALFARAGGLYGHDDDWHRFAALARAAADLASGAVAGQRFALLHAHDWQAALAPAYLRHAPAPAPGPVAASVVTIHNIAFQGRFEAEVFAALGLPDAAWALDGVEYYGGVGYLKAGLEAADAITTVSPTYAAEIRDGRFGMGLEGLIEARRDRVSGIVNGIDPAVWSPADDAALPARYTARTLTRRAANKRAVEAQFALEAGAGGDGGPLFTVISRLTEQKGIDVLAAGLGELVALGGRLALLGSGDAALEAAMMEAAARHPGRIGVRIGYDEPLSHLLQGGADAILIPSRFEPCGLTQLYGLAYGCVPVVARTGGLADTVIDANEAALAAGVATGFQMGEVTPAALSHVLARVADVYATPARWTCLQRNGMRADFSWDESGRRYAALYASLLEQT
jgi:starch synthase